MEIVSDSRGKNIFCPSTFQPKVHITLAQSSAKIHCYTNKVSGPELLHYLLINQNNFQHIHSLHLSFCPDIMEKDSLHLLNLDHVLEMSIRKPQVQEKYQIKFDSTLVKLKTLRLISFEYLNLEEILFGTQMNISRLTIEDTKNLFLKENAFLEMPSLRYLGFAEIE